MSVSKRDQSRNDLYSEEDFGRSLGETNLVAATSPRGFYLLILDLVDLVRRGGPTRPSQLSQGSTSFISPAVSPPIYLLDSNPPPWLFFFLLRDVDPLFNSFGLTFFVCLLTTGSYPNSF